MTDMHFLDNNDDDGDVGVVADNSVRGRGGGEVEERRRGRGK